MRAPRRRDQQGSDLERPFHSGWYARAVDDVEILLDGGGEVVQLEDVCVDGRDLDGGEHEERGETGRRGRRRYETTNGIIRSTERVNCYATYRKEEDEREREEGKRAERVYVWVKESAMGVHRQRRKRDRKTPRGMGTPDSCMIMSASKRNMRSDTSRWKLKMPCLSS